ncbi:hypothetical protein F503_04967 [Ophiostoma piceae UAMH 11346]|uniref:Uncharacterized protein n=1 Tax=Ophiostoma piceae (strain UAMH 11346) TaxID=1262450 RepID=S3CAG6_OPHP1|nr:hypothetical protein F503_04967 [Ophiostoma piceae UAMH 11346]
MDLFAYSVAPAQFHDLSNSSSCSFSPSYSSFSLSPVCSPASSSPFAHITKPQLLLLRTTQQLLAWSSADAPPPPAASTMALSSDSALCQWALVLVLTALCLSLLLSLLVSAQIVARYTAAYWAAPREIATLLDAADSSLQENESYDRDVVARVPQREDKIRLGRMLQEIQRASDDLREDLNNVLVGGHSQQYGSTEAVGMSTGAAQLVDQKQPVRRKASQQHIAASTTAYCSSLSTSVSPQLRTVARILWAARRIHIEERVRRLDMLRMRFLVVYMSIVAATTTAAAEKTEKSAIIVAAAAVAVSTPAPAPATAPAAPPTTPAPGRASNSTSTTIAATKRTRTPPTKAAASRTVKLTKTTTPALKHISSSASSEDSSGDDSDSESDSSACSSPLMSAASMPTSPQSPRKTPASIVAASIAKAAADAVAAGDTNGKYHPGSPTSPGLSTPPTISEAPDTPPRSGRSHPFLRSITEQQQLRSPPATPDPTSPTPDIGGFRRKPTRRVTALGIRPPEASPENNHRAGWMGVVQELQRSPLLHKRHTSIEMSMARQTK